MKRYYCDWCGSVVHIPDWVYVENQRLEKEKYVCSVCVGTVNTMGKKQTGTVFLAKVNDWETPEQYKDRTGHEYPSDGSVWALDTREEVLTKDWGLSMYSDARKWPGDIDTVIVVVADPPYRPSFDWRPE